MDSGMYIYDHDLKLKQTLPHKIQYISNFTSDDMFFTCNFNLGIWDTLNMQNVYTLDQKIHLSAILNENSILVGMDNLVGIVDLRIGTILNTVPSKGLVTSLYTKNDNDIYNGDMNGHLNLIDKRMMKVVNTNETDSPVCSIIYKDHIISQGNELLIWGDDLVENHALVNIPHSVNIYNSINFIKVFLDYLIIPCNDGDIGLYNTTSKIMTKVDGHFTRITSLEILDKIQTHSEDGILGTFELIKK